MYQDLPDNWLDPTHYHEALPKYTAEMVTAEFFQLLTDVDRKDETLPPEHYLYGEPGYGPFSVTASWTLLHNPRVHDDHPGRYW